ncbi:diguanylate cyclase [Pseudomonas sp. NPDC078700]|uniref:diguanylate cyclase n=1 Tax=Pseudomonas sp. NPDC078700 TaxID=3364424 RepID=UPI0037C8307A
MREQDFIGRWGGEEFIAILPDANFSHAVESAERIRKAVQALEMHCPNWRGQDLSKIPSGLAATNSALPFDPIHIAIRMAE